MNKPIHSVWEITPQDLFVNKGLYQPFHYLADTLNEAKRIVHCKESIDCYCVGCGKHSIFSPEIHRSSPNVYGNNPPDIVTVGLNEYVTHQKKFICTRNDEHILSFTLLMDRGILTKIGQFPTYADIHLQDIEKYKSLLPNDLYLEFKKAIGLFANGIGAGSLVYLRRIIEKFMIEPAHQKAKTEQTNWDDDAYGKARMREKIKLLTYYLPDYLVANPVVYGIVSKGIHELSEKECQEYFPVLKSFIEVVLTDMKNERDAEATKRQLAADLDKIAGKIK